MASRLSLRQLEVFAAICRLGTVSAAAESVRLSQSAASQSLAELESALDGPLFDRVGRRLQINERGRELLPLAVDLLDRGAALEAQLRNRGPAPPPAVRLAASLTIGSYLLPPLVAQLLARQPQARIELSVMNTEAVIAEVLAFRADAGFIEGPGEDPDLQAHAWRDDRLLVVAAPQHPLVERHRITADDLQTANWILRERGSGTREVFERAVRAADISIHTVLELGDTEAVKRAIACGTALSCLSELAVADAVTRGELRTLKTPFLDLRRRLFVILHRRKYLGRGLRDVLRACGLQAL